MCGVDAPSLSSGSCAALRRELLFGNEAGRSPASLSKEGFLPNPPPSTSLSSSLLSSLSALNALEE